MHGKVIGVARVCVAQCAAALLLILALVSTSRAQDINRLHKFQGPDGLHPQSGLIRGTDGTLYGAVKAGTGASVHGNVYQLKPDGAGGYVFSVIYSFCTKKRCIDGRTPANAPLTLRDGKLYGSTVAGGSFDSGVVFELTPPIDTNSKWNIRILHTFNAEEDYISPLDRAAVAFGSNGDLYGVADSGNNGRGVVYSLTPRDAPSKRWRFRTVYQFGAGRSPASGVIVDEQGSIYGTTRYGGNCGLWWGGFDGCGTVYRLDPPQRGSIWTETILHQFSGANSGAWPDYPPAFYPGGALVGITLLSRGSCGGTAYLLSPPQSAGDEWQETIIADFGSSANPPCSTPNSGLLVGPDGSMYGSADGFTDSTGSLYKISPPPKNSNLWATSNLWLTDNGPYGAVVMDPLGNIFGNTSGGGYYNFPNCGGTCGTVYMRAEPAPATARN